MALLAFIAFMDFIAFMAGIVFIFFMVEVAFMALALATCRRQCKTQQNCWAITRVALLALPWVTSRCMQGLVKTNTWGRKHTCLSTCMGWLNLNGMQTYLVYIYQ